MNERKTNYMQLLYIFIVAVGDALHVSGVFAQHQERQKTKPVAYVFCNE
jgi:surface polysaccharide O-acyltransferase-like enzyme